MKHIITLETWNRQEHFNFFSQFDEPFWGVTVNVDVKVVYDFAKKNKINFYASYLYLILRSVNKIEALKIRYNDKEIYYYKIISVSPTVLRDDGSFGFSYVDFNESYHQFSHSLQDQIEKVRTSKGLNLGEYRDDVIHFSALPWLNFTALSHARSFKNIDCCPKISVGQLQKKKRKYILPISIHVNHALVDGYHINLFFKALEDAISDHSHLLST